MELEGYNSEKQYYSIGEVAKMFNLSISNIRFWEQEFDILKPKKNKKGDRFFTKQDIENLKVIHHLLKEKGYTIEGARKKLSNNPHEVSDRITMIDSLKKIRAFLVSLKESLDKKGGETNASEKDAEKDAVHSNPADTGTEHQN